MPALYVNVAFAEKNQNVPSRGRWEQMGNFLRPPMIQPFECRNVRIEGISLRDPPLWTINPVYCDDVTVTGITIKNPDDSPNTDGINPDSCRNVHISDCDITVRGAPAAGTSSCKPTSSAKLLLRSR